MRRDRLVPMVAIAYYVAMLIFLTYPGYVPFSRIRPFVLGMPFALFWQVVWISGAIAVLTAVYLWEIRRGAGRGGPSGSTSAGPDRVGSGDVRGSESGRGISPASGGAE